MNIPPQPLRCMEVRDTPGNPKSPDGTPCWEAVDPGDYLPPPRRGMKPRGYPRDAELRQALWLMFHGPLPADTVITRGCGQALCCNPHHLVVAPSD